METYTPRSYSDQEVNQSFSENALKMMRKRYLRPLDDGSQETPAQMMHRVARALAEVEFEYDHDEAFVAETEQTFFDIMASKEFTPGGRTVTNAGSKTPLIPNCIVLPIEDSMEGIFQTLKEAALLQQAGSGLGFPLDALRPAMSPTVRSQGVASGPVSFLRVYNEAFGTIKQQGRHGANMAMMSVDHPEVLDFVRSKEIEGEIANFNISVKVTDEFMQKLVESPNEQWYCTWKGEKVKPRASLRHPNGSVYGTEELDMSVGELFDELVHYAWTNGEPGIVFIDTVNRTNPLPGLGDIPSSNPCGEQFLHPYDNCNLGSINLARFVTDGVVDYAHLKEVTRASVRMLDNVVDRFEFPVGKLEKMAKGNRRVGLGVMGFADMLYQLGVKYDSEEGIATAERVMSAIQEAAHEMSEELAKEKHPFPNYELSIFPEGNRRNAALTTVAPTGSISMMLDTSSGIEPNFALAFIKQDKDGEQYQYLNEHFRNALEQAGLDDETIQTVKDEVVAKGTVQHLDMLPQEIKDVFVVAMDISGEDHIRMQAAFQKHVDNSISKTINLPNSASHEDVKQSYISAWQLGCKSSTVYRDGSRTVQILNVGKDGKIKKPTDIGKKGVASDAASESTPEPIEEPVVESRRSRERMGDKVSPRKRPEVLNGKTYKVKTGYGNLYITVNDDENNDPFEVFATIGKTGGFFQEQSEAICRLISLSLRAGIDMKSVIKTIRGIRGPMPVFTNKGTILSLPDAVARVLEDHMKNGGANGHQIKKEVEKLEESHSETVASVLGEDTVGAYATIDPKDAQEEDLPLADYGMMPECPDCSRPLQMSEGCMSCPSCGFSRCG